MFNYLILNKSDFKYFRFDSTNKMNFKFNLFRNQLVLINYCIEVSGVLTNF